MNSNTQKEISIKKRVGESLRRLSAVFQNKESSVKRHNKNYTAEGSFEMERQAAAKYKKENQFNSAENKIASIVSKADPQSVCIDIGSGAGWLSAELSSKFSRVIGIEPSEHAIDIAKRLYPQSEYKNIEWMHGFAEDILPSINTNGKPLIFLTGCVFSHMRDKDVENVCKIVNQIAPAGSLLSFSECWGAEYHQKMWHVRTKEWWQKVLPGFELDFHGPEIQNIPGRHKGFHGKKRA